MTASRRLILAMAALALSGGAAGQSWPGKPIRLVVPFPAGGGTDIIARESAQRVSMATGWTFVIDNKPGAGGNIGVDAVAKAPADGYTIVIGQTSNLAINTTLYSKMPYDSVKDLAPIVLLANAPLVLVTNNKTPFKALGEMITAAKAAPDRVTFASPGNGTVSHLAGELLQRTANFQVQHVPYKGSAPAMNDLLGGTVDLYMSSVPTLLSHIKAGRVRPLAVTSLKRTDDLPNVPTVSESGYKNFNAVTWFGLLAPANTPKDVIAKLNAEFNKALKTPELLKRLSDEGADVAGGTPEQFGALIKEEITRWGKVVKESGATVD